MASRLVRRQSARFVHRGRRRARRRRVAFVVLLLATLSLAGGLLVVGLAPAAPRQTHWAR